MRKLEPEGRSGNGVLDRDGGRRIRRLLSAQRHGARHSEQGRCLEREALECEARTGHGGEIIGGGTGRGIYASAGAAYKTISYGSQCPF